MIPYDRLRPGDYATFAYHGNKITGKLWADEMSNLRIGPILVDDSSLEYVCAERNNQLPQERGAVISYTFDEGDSHILTKVSEDFWAGVEHGQLVHYNDDFLRSAGVWEQQ